jgi:hypothetical protein
MFLRRQFPEWKLAELSADANLEFSLSPAFPRAFIRYGQHAWAALACPPDGDAAAVISFALIWLDYLRAREKRVVVEGLAVYVPEGRELCRGAAASVSQPETARFELFAHTEDDIIESVDPATTAISTRDSTAAAVPTRDRPSPTCRGRRVPKHDGRGVPASAASSSPRSPAVSCGSG